MTDCDFCDIIDGHAAAAVAYADETFLVFADYAPIRPGHVQIVPRKHVETFERLSPEMASGIIHLGQRIARAQKRIFGVDRVGFVFTGNDVPHTHAHVIPLFEATDVTSLQYFERKDVSVVGAPRISAQAMSATARVLSQALTHEVGWDEGDDEEVEMFGEERSCVRH